MTIKHRFFVLFSKTMWGSCFLKLERKCDKIVLTVSMEQFIPRDDLDSLLTEQMSITKDDKNTQNVLESMSNFDLQSVARKSKERRSFASMLNNRTLNSIQNNQKTEENVTLIMSPFGQNGIQFETRKIHLIPGKEVMIGRVPGGYRTKETTDCGIFDCRVLSRKHAIIWYNSGKIFLKDLDSSNGTFVNDKKVQAQKVVHIEHGDVVQFGQDVCDMSLNQSKCIIAKVTLVGKEDEKENLKELKDAMNKLEVLDDSVDAKLNRVKDTLKKVQNEVQENWKSMVQEDCLLSKIQDLESRLVQKSTEKSKLLILEDKITLLQVENRFLRKSYKTCISLNIYSSLFLTILLLAFFIYTESFGIRRSQIAVW